MASAAHAFSLLDSDVYGFVLQEVGLPFETPEEAEVETRRIKTEEIINTATIRGVFKNRFQITGLTQIEARDLAVLLRAGAGSRYDQAVVEQLGRDHGSANGVDEHFQHIGTHLDQVFRFGDGL